MFDFVSARCVMSDARFRDWCLAGALITTVAIALGLYPSLFSINALLVLPAPIVFAHGIIRPQQLMKRTAMRRYLVLCLLTSSIVLIWTATWLAGHAMEAP